MHNGDGHGGDVTQNDKESLVWTASKCERESECSCVRKLRVWVSEES